MLVLDKLNLKPKTTNLLLTCSPDFWCPSLLHYIQRSHNISLLHHFNNKESQELHPAPTPNTTNYLTHTQSQISHRNLLWYTQIATSSPQGKSTPSSWKASLELHLEMHQESRCGDELSRVGKGSSAIKRLLPTEQASTRLWIPATTNRYNREEPWPLASPALTSALPLPVHWLSDYRGALAFSGRGPTVKAP